MFGEAKAEGRFQAIHFLDYALLHGGGKARRGGAALLGRFSALLIYHAVELFYQGADRVGPHILPGFSTGQHLCDIALVVDPVF